MSKLLKVNTIAGDARMHEEIAPRFDALRKAVLDASGVDFLAHCGDVLRPASFQSKKDGVANRSWHKTGRAFDYDQSSKALVIVSEFVGGKQYFRTYLKCARQDGSQGTMIAVRDMRGYTVRAYLVDFTNLAAAHGFKRIPAWNGWQSHYNRREFWHYQKDDGLTWDAAMQQIKSQPAAPTATAVRSRAVVIIGRNDRDSNTGKLVTPIQRSLNQAGFLPKAEVDGIYGAKTYAAVVAFQKHNGLPADGLVGPQTAAKLGVTL